MSLEVIARLRVAGIVLVGYIALGLAGSTMAFAETVTFSYTGGEQEFKVPARIRRVYVEAVGSEGGTELGAAPGGKGAVVRGDLSANPGEVLYVEVGGMPFNGGGGASGNRFAMGGGKGGGASDIRTVSIGAEPSPGDELSLDSRLLVAGGGGGAGGDYVYEGQTCAGGPGGGAEQNGTDGSSCGFPGGGGGGAGDASKGGAGGITYEREIRRPSGGDGQPGQWGAGGESFLGGGGGGGLYGGGGGGFQNVARSGNPPQYAGNGGGGGGSNLVPAGGMHALDEDGAPPAVVITYMPSPPPKAVCTTNTGTITLSPGLTGTPVYQGATIKGTLTGCTGEPFAEAKYTMTVTTTSKVTCSALSGPGVPTFGSVKYAWTPKTKPTYGTLSLPLAETAGVALTGELESGPYSPLTLSGTASESYANAAKCGVSQGKYGVIKAVTKGTFTGSAVNFE